jgi:hypothetical protein
MSYPDPINSAAPAPAAPAVAPPGDIEYKRMYSYVFENPNWTTNVLLGGLCFLSATVVPVLGPLLMLGYQYEVVLALLASRGARYPDFDFNRFTEYLLRGLWPFLVQLICSLVLLPVYFVLIGVPLLILFGLAAAAGDDGAAAVFIIGLPLMLLIVIPLCILPTLLFLPMMLRAGLALDFAEAFQFAWTIDFLKRTWYELLLAFLFLAFTGAVLVLLGLLACYIGMFAVMPVLMLAQSHLLYQIYLLFLARGGEPIPVKLNAK